LIVLIANAHRLVAFPKGSDGQGYLLQPHPFNNAIDVFDTTSFAGTPVHCEVMSLRPASRDQSDTARSGNGNPVVRQMPPRRTTNNTR